MWGFPKIGVPLTCPQIVRSPSHKSDPNKVPLFSETPMQGVVGVFLGTILLMMHGKVTQSDPCPPYRPHDYAKQLKDVT